MATERDEQDAALAQRHAEREKITHASDVIERKHYETEESVITAFKFPTSGYRIQITARGDAAAASGTRYLNLSLVGAAALYRELGVMLRNCGVLP